MFTLDTKTLAAVDRPIESANGLPNAVYTDPGALELERERVFKRSWTAVGFASDVPDRGSARPVDLLGIPLMLVRGRDGQVNVFHNVCRHRGHTLVSEPCKLKGSISCPYHAWTYTLDGELRGTPNIGGAGVNSVDGFDKSQYSLLRVRSHVWMDIVFVDLSGDLPDFVDHARPLIDRWEQFLGPNGDANYVYTSTARDLEFSLRTNWKFPIENYLESYHLPTIHPELNSYSRLEDHYNIIESDIGGGQGTLVYDFSGQANIALPKLDAWPQAEYHKAEYVALYPNVMLGIQVDHAFAVIVDPVEVNQTRERLRLYFLEESAGAGFKREREIVRDGWEIVFAQDVSAVEGMQTGRQSPQFDGGVFSPVLDTPTHDFHKWVARKLAA